MCSKEDVWKSDVEWRFEMAREIEDLQSFSSFPLLQFSRLIFPLVVSTLVFYTFSTLPAIQSLLYFQYPSRLVNCIHRLLIV